MKYKAVLFDLDGTLLPTDTDAFTRIYFKGLCEALAPAGYEPKMLVDSIWQCVKAMALHPEKTNEQAFWDEFYKIYGEKAKADIKYFDEYYKTDFDKAKEICGCNEYAKKVVDTLKAKGVRVIVATNPFFPKIAVEKRISWAGLKFNDFELVTTYENSHYLKPDPRYFTEILEKCSLKAEDCLMVGNDAEEDMAAKLAGLDVFLLTDCLLNKKNIDISGYNSGDFVKLYEIIENS